MPEGQVDGPDPAPRDTWNEGEVRRFIAASSGDRLAAVWLLSLLGLRRGEICGLRWRHLAHRGHAVPSRTPA